MFIILGDSFSFLYNNNNTYQKKPLKSYDYEPWKKIFKK